MGLTAGSAVRIARGDRAGQTGTVALLYQEPGCGCLHVIVRLADGREWAGTSIELELMPERIPATGAA